MLSFKKVTLLLLLLLEGSRQEGDQWLANCQAKNSISVAFNKTAISIVCSQNTNNDLVESVIKCAYGEYKAQHGEIHEVGEVSSLEISECRVDSNLTIKTILHLLEVSNKQIRSIRIVKNKAPLNSIQLTGLQSVTNFYIDDLENRLDLETFTALSHLKELTIKIKIDCLEIISNKTIFGQLENFHMDMDGYWSAVLDNKNILRDLMAISDKFKKFKLFHFHPSDERRTILIENESFGNNKGLEVLEVTHLVGRIKRHAFDNLQNLKQLEITSGEVTTIHSEFLPSSLKVLDLSANRLVSFIGGAHLTNLEELRLNSNQIETFDAKELPSSLKILHLIFNPLTTFIGGTHLTNLQKLRFMGNQFENFDGKILPSSLKFLDLSRGRLTTFIGGTHLINLEELWLKHNQFKTFDAKTLPSSLKILDLSDNQLKFFIGGTHLTNLDKLKLFDNQFENFDAKVLPTSLKILDISQSRLTSFIGGARLTNLEELWLKDNQFEKFDAKTLPSSLKILDLSYNGQILFIGGTHLTNLKKLWLSPNNFETFDVKTLPSSLKFLELSFNRLASFIGKMHLTNLEELNLKENQIEKFDAKMLPSSLKFLDISSNQLTSFIGGTHLTNLDTIRLERNQFKTFDANTLPSSLKILELSFNRLTFLVEGTHLIILEDLRLNDNQIEIFDANILPSSLKILDISSNELTSFIGGTHLTYLDTIRLERNQFETFDANTLPSSLKILDLSSNQLKSFIGGTHLTNLDELKLNDNQFETFDTKRLPSSLKILHLSNNRLKRLFGGAHLTILEDLILNANQIETFDTKKWPSSLKIIDLAFNRLTTFIMGTHLTNLERLRLDNNQFEIFDTNSLPSSLKLLDLTANKLKEFVIKKHLSYLEELNLASNAIFSFTLNLEELPKLRIISLKANRLKWLNVFGSWRSSLKKVNLDKNYIQNLDAWRWIYKHQENISHDGTYPLCDCNLQNKGTQEYIYVPFYIWLKCRLPIPESFFIYVFELECETEKTNHCNTYKSSYMNSQFMNCSKSDLSQNGVPRFVIYDYIETLHIYFTGNKLIHFLPRFPEKIEYRNFNVCIYAEHCRITNPFLVNNLAQIPNLERLQMANNNISEIDVSALRMLEKKRTKLTLSGNPFKCDCDHQLMYDTITQVRPLIEDYNRMTCSDGSKFIPNRSLCFQWQTLFWSLTVVALMLAFGLAIFYIFFSLEVKIFIYSRGWFPAMFRPDSDEQPYVYDVFVSYSELDEDYVYSIIDFLEHDISPPLKICHHNRDWIGGDRIDRQIINSVETSRKTLIILSHNFLTSYWGSLEFRTAFLTMLHEKTSKLVLVVYGDLGPLDELKPEIRSYIKTTTYIASDNKWFWKRLAYALRRPKDAKMEDEKENDVSEKVIVESAV